ncbi:MAG: sulfate ABC transporter substrate-binding protein [Planctomycetota bacterium]|jgi:sulfate transport system substrate-binding protein|nr:sulfate ABC transporter substrate-binding protein [Planctomycetota bacterium]
MRNRFFGRVLALALVAGAGYGANAAEKVLLNISYDTTREFYRAYNEAFVKYYREKTGDAVTVKQSHSGSGGQAKAVVAGAEADVVTLALASDIDEIADAGLIAPNWQTRLPDNSAPYTSTVVFLVRAGNPKNVKDWDDLARNDVKVITPDPKNGGGARWNYLAAWGYGLEKFGDDAQARAFVKKIFANVPVLEPGGRRATTTFVRREIGDVLLTWENEAFLTISQQGKDKFEIVVPSLSILAEPAVAWVDKVTAKNGTRELAAVYLRYLYSPAGQRLAGKNYYRPRDAEIAKEFTETLPDLKLITVDAAFGGLKKAQKRHFADGGEFDQINRELHWATD